MRKIINDPVYGFITIDDLLIMNVISHPFYQRLRHINQMALANLVYPGAVHSRFHHALGAYHLMCNALAELANKSVIITDAESQAAKIAILLHDIGHGPFSHALENTLAENMRHEEISLMIMEQLNEEMNGALQLSIDIFTNNYHKQFLHQLISGQLDVDRMDYLTRDSFFSGVSEGVIGYDRILKMLTVHDGQLMVEEKGIYSIEKFLVARRLMYWQVYLHKTVLAAEQMLKRIIKRAKFINAESEEPLNSFINKVPSQITLEQFCSIDDTDVMMAMKKWRNHPDKILSTLCQGIIDRKLLKIKYYGSPISDELILQHKSVAIEKHNISKGDIDWLVFAGEVSSNTYNFSEEHIKVLFKNGEVKNISDVDHALINENLKGSTKKYYICYIN